MMEEINACQTEGHLSIRAERASQNGSSSGIWSSDTWMRESLTTFVVNIGRVTYHFHVWIAVRLPFLAKFVLSVVWGPDDQSIQRRFWRVFVYPGLIKTSVKPLLSAIGNLYVTTFTLLFSLQFHAWSPVSLMGQIMPSSNYESVDFGEDALANSKIFRS